jgi:UbiD family decarboxylase
MAYRDFREHLKRLEEAGLLVRIRRPLCKDTEIHPLVRWQFRGLEEGQRRAFLFENIIDAKGRHYEMPLVVGALAASRDIYCLAMDCTPENFLEKTSQGLMRRIPPAVVESGPCQEVVHSGETLLEHGGLAEFPIPISTPGFDIAPYTTYSHWVTKDPDSGVYNVGNYRGQLKSPTRMGVFAAYPQHLGMHWERARELGRPLEAALFIGAVPAVSFVANTKIPYETDEYEAAGGIAGEPIELVRCRTVDLLVPATAELVIEGRIRTDCLEPEAPFGETTGYMGHQVMANVFEVTGITHRRKPILASIISQFPPSESTKLRQMSFEPTFYKHLRYDCNIPAITGVAFLESCSSYYYCVIQLKKTNPAQAWQALNAAVGYDSGIGKIFVAVDDDIDPRDADAVNWAICGRAQPHRDVRVREGRSVMMDFSAVHPRETSLGAETLYPPPNGASALVIDATRKWEYPPVSLPARAYMERARTIWEELGLPALRPKSPWFGYHLGYWTRENEEDAERAVRGEYFVTGERLSERREAVGKERQVTSGKPVPVGGK